MSTPPQPFSPDAFTTFGDLLKYLRRRERLTQLELSIAVGYSEAQISRLEKNQRLPDVSAVQALFVPALHLDGQPEIAARLLDLARTARQEDAPAPGIPPYKGLLYFDEQDADLFFGRETLTAHLVKRVQGLAQQPEGRLLAVVGASGSGKSSVVRAGLAIALRRAGWQTVVWTPTAHPLRALPRALAEGTADSAAPVLYVVDQFEEVFTLCHDEAERARFVETLLAASNLSGARSVLALALRADFYARCAQYPPLRQALAANQEFIGQMSAAELRSAIEQPAKKNGWDFEPGLVDVMLAEIGADSGRDQEPGALPLLSHALLSTWERRRGRTFTLEGYRSSGGVRGAIAETAESVFTDQFDDSQQALARDIFLRLTELGEGTEDTRRRAALSELVPSAGQAAPLRGVLDILADARLVSLNEDSAEVAHEALIREWARLREWLNQDRDALRLHRQLTEAAREWELLARDPGALYRGARLAAALEFAGANPTALNVQEQSFLEASQALAQAEAAEREAQRQRELEAAQRLAAQEQRHAADSARAAAQLRRRAYLVSGAFVVAVILAALALFFATQAQSSASAAAANAQQAQQAQRLAAARELAAGALNSLPVDPQLGVLLAMQAVKTTYDVDHTVPQEAEEALHRVLPQARLQLTIQDDSKLYSVAYSPDGAHLATIDEGNNATIWDAATGKRLLTLTGHTAPLEFVAYSPDGTRLATSSNDRTARLWDAATGKELLQLAHPEVVLGLAFTRDGKRLATSSADQTARVWDTTSGKLLSEFRASGAIIPVAFDKDGTHLAVGGEGFVSVWDVASGQEVLHLDEKDGAINSLVYSPDGSELAIVGGPVPAVVVDAKTGQQKAAFANFKNQVNSIVFSPDGSQVATAGLDHSVKIWDPQTGFELMTLAGHTGGITRAVFSPDGKHVATSSLDGTARVWDITPPRELLTIWAGDFTGRVRFDASGTRIVGDSSGQAKIWDAATGQELGSFTCAGCAAGPAVSSPDGSRIAAGDRGNDAHVWDVSTRQLLLTLKGHNAAVNSIAYSADGKTIATGSDDKTAILWDATTGKLLRTFAGHHDGVSWVAVSPDGSQLATASFDGTAILWDAATGKPSFTLKHGDVVWGVAFSTDGKRVGTASRDGTAKIWDAATGQEQLTLRGHAGTVVGVTFSPDGKRIATASHDGTVKIWDALTGTEQLTIPVGELGSDSVGFSPDDKRLLTDSAEGLVREFVLPIEDLMALAQSRVTRTFTPDECRIYLHVSRCPDTH